MLFRLAVYNKMRDGRGAGYVFFYLKPSLLNEQGKQGVKLIF